MRSDTGDVHRRLLHVRENIVLALKFTDGMAKDEFLDDVRTFYAATRCLEIISEASRHLPPELKSRHPQIAWKDMAGAGNIYRHDYEDVAARRVWSALDKDLPLLLAAVQAELARCDS